MASKVKGLDRLLRQLEALPNSVRSALYDSLAEGAKDMAGAIARAAPERDGDLKASVGWSEGEPPPTKATGAFRFTVKKLGPQGRALNDAGLLFSVYAGDDKAYYARWVEFGTSAKAAIGARYRISRSISSLPGRRVRARKAARAHAATPAQPFFYPTIRANKKVLRARVIRAANRAAKAVAALR
ncbi:MAG: family phage protein [Caulobacter sp.]|nr:family phage protein [Caulobacter sp.]